MTPEISVIIPSTGNTSHLRRLLGSLQKQNLERPRLEVLLILNGVAADRQAELRELSGVYDFDLQVVFLPERGVNAARSYGLHRGRGAILFFVDDDCELEDPSFLRWHLEYHRLNPQIFAVGGGYQLPLNSGFFDDLYNDIQMRWLHAGRNGERSRFLLGGNFSVKGEMARTRGLDFDRRILYGGSESDFFRQADLGQLEMQVCEMDLLHHTRESWRSLGKKVFKQGKGKAFTDAKYGKFDLAAEGDRPPLSLRLRLFGIYFNYVFWAGYYWQLRRPLALAGHMLRDLWGKFHLRRARWAERLNRSVSEKKERGRRF